MTGFCGLCEAQAVQRCSRCQTVYYCGREHQEKDWPAHRANCLTYMVKRSDILGRHLVAAQYLRRGNVVLREQPLLTGPIPDTQQLLCVACYRPLPATAGDPFAQCPRGCGWPVCGEACAQSERHQPECQLQFQLQKKADVEAALLAGRPVYRALMVARALLLCDSDPGTYAKLRAMEAHCSKRRASGAWERERRTLAAFLLPFFKLEERFSPFDVLYIAGVLQVNTYPVLVSGRHFVAVYNEASFIEHNCVPNVAKVFSSDGELLLRAVSRVRRGEHLSICYVDPRLGTAPRRRKLAEELLDCRCRRCVDPTELATGFSALRCTQPNCAGEVNPSQPIVEMLPEGGNAEWRCDTCLHMIPAADADAAVNEAAIAAAAAADGVQAAADFLESSVARRLAANHYLLLGPRVTAACGSGLVADRSDAQLAAVESELRRLLTLVETLMPGEVALCGKLQYHLYETVMERNMRVAKLECISAKALQKQTEGAKYFLVESVMSMENFSEEVPEGQLRSQAQQQLKEFDSLLEALSTQFGSAKPLGDNTVSYQATASAATATLAAADH